MPLKSFIKNIFTQSDTDLNQSTKPPLLDGEIVYSKNNVCVHPPGPLSTSFKHYPGYLTLYAKVSGDNTSLVLNWIPNKGLEKGKNPIERSDKVTPIHSATQACSEEIDSSLLIPSKSPLMKSVSNAPIERKHIKPHALPPKLVQSYEALPTTETIKNLKPVLLRPLKIPANVSYMKNSGLSCSDCTLNLPNFDCENCNNFQKHSPSNISLHSQSQTDGFILSDVSIENTSQCSDSTEGPDSDDRLYSDEDELIVFKSNITHNDTKYSQPISRRIQSDCNDNETFTEKDLKIIQQHILSDDDSEPMPDNTELINRVKVVKSIKSSDCSDTDSDNNPDTTMQNEFNVNYTISDEEMKTDEKNIPNVPLSPPVVYNMQFPENSVTYISSSNDSSRENLNNSCNNEVKGRVIRPAKDQAYGIFNVDLSLMRSLRLFFSNDACSSGQLVIASRESQYKVLHFHHGGLDNLAEIFEEWKLCVKQNPKRNEELAIHHFSICGPQLSVGQCHPEEGLYRRLSLEAWALHMNEFGQVEDEYNIRKAVFFGGMEAALRHAVWPFLLKYYDFNSTVIDRQELRITKSLKYEAINQARLSMNKEEKESFWRSVACTVEKDVLRTDRANPYYSGENNPNLDVLRRILLNYAVHSNTGYTQGMSDLLSPLLKEIQNEPDVFWCFVGLMERTIFISSPKDDDMEKQLMYLRELLRIMQPNFYDHLNKSGQDAMELLFAHRWILLCFKREFSVHEVLMMWESCWAHYQTDYFHLFICVAIIAIYGEDVVENKLASDEMLLHFSNLAMQMNGQIVLRKARGLMHAFRVRPKIPCTLHDLCILSPPGVWDSGYAPMVQCTGNHGDEECSFGGKVAQNNDQRRNSFLRNLFR